MKPWRLVAVLFFVAAPVLRADAPAVFAIRGGTVHPASGPPIANGIVVIRGGLIEAVGASVTVPADAMPIDATGSHVYPGLFDAQSTLGFSAAPRAAGGERPAEPSADSLAVRSVRLSDDDLDAARAAGITTIVTAPTTGIFNGQSVILNLGSGAAESRVVRNPAALQISFNPRPSWTWPDSLMGVMAYLRQSFLDAQQYAAAREVYDRSPAGLQRPAENPGIDALRPALRRELPVVFLADSREMIARARAIAGEFNLRLIVSGAREAHAIAGDLKNVPLLVSVKWPVAPTDRDDREDQPLRVIRERQLAPTTPAALARSGAAFALVSNPGKPADFLAGVRKALENGLTAEQALLATTLTPARIFGVDRQLGSLERGKIANVVIADRPIFSKDAKLTRLFIDGREIRLPDEKKKDASSATTTAIDGTWAISVRAPQGNVAIQVTLRAEAGRLSGTFSGDRGSGDIRGGSFEGERFEFTISSNAQNEAEASDWVFRGTTSGSAMTGSVTTTLGNFEFSGSKSE